MGPENLSPTMLIQGVSTDAFFLKWCCAALSMSRSSRGSYWKRSQRNLQEKSFACSFGADMCFGDCALKIQLSTSSSHIRSGLFHLRRRHRACKRRHLRIRVQALALRHDRIQPQNFRWPEGKAIRFGVDAGKRARADLGSTCLYSLVMPDRLIYVVGTALRGSRGLRLGLWTVWRNPYSRGMRFGTASVRVTTALESYLSACRHDVPAFLPQLFAIRYVFAKIKVISVAIAKSHRA